MRQPRQAPPLGGGVRCPVCARGQAGPAAQIMDALPLVHWSYGCFVQWKTAEFWGDYGRVAKIHKGPWAGRFLFAYPDTVEGWWTIVVDPGFNPGTPGDLYIDDADFLADLERDGEFDWLPLGDAEKQIEQDHFDWRKELDPKTRSLTGFQARRRKLRGGYVDRP